MTDRTKYLVQGFKRGFDIRYRGPLIRKSKANNIPLSVGTPFNIWSKVMKEVKLGRYSGPFKQSPFKSYIQFPIGLVPKAGNQTQLVFHLSYDFGEDEDEKSLNFHTPDEYCLVKYKDLDYAIRTSLRLREILGWDIQSKNQQEVIFMAKSDLKSAFRILPILVWQRKYLVLKARHPVTKETWFFVEKNLPFRASSSARFFKNLVMDCITLLSLSKATNSKSQIIWMTICSSAILR